MFSTSPSTAIPSWAIILSASRVARTQASEGRVTITTPVKLNHLGEAVQLREARGEIDKHQVERAKARSQQAAQRGTVVDLKRPRAVERRGRRRRLVGFDKAERHRFAVGQLARGRDPQAQRTRRGIDLLARREAPQRFQPEHPEQAGRVEVGVDDCDLTPGNRQRGRDVDADRALADAAPGAGHRHNRAHFGQLQDGRRTIFCTGADRRPLGPRLAEDSCCQ